MKAPYIIAEIGQNHQGDVYTAIRLVHAAIKAGADCVKFQLRDAEREFTAEQLAAPHPIPHHAFGRTYGEHRKQLDLTIDELRHIHQRIQYNNWKVDFAVTACHVSCVEPLRGFDMPFWKVASKDCGNTDLLGAIHGLGGNLWVSTGGATDEEVEQAAKYAELLFHCVRKYPTPLEEANLIRIAELQRFGLPVGWSDHTGRPTLGGAAAAYSAQVFEAHITFDKRQPGRDHMASLTLQEFKQWAESIRDVHKSLAGNLQYESV